MTRRSIRISLFIALWLSPILLIAAMIWRYASDVPYGDDFAIADEFYRSVIGGLRWSELIAQHNESRLFFPRLIFYSLAKLSGGDLRWQMAASVSCVAATSLLLIRICRRSGVTLAVALLANLLLFSPVQWLNFLWGIQFIVFVPALSLAAIMLLLGSSHRLWLTMPIAAIAAVVATFCNSNGLLVWIVPLPFFMLHRSRFRFAAMGFWIVIAIMTISYYFHGYQSPGDPAMADALKRPIAAITFILAFLGNGVRLTTNPHTAAFIGLIAVVVWLSGVTCITLSRHRVVLWNKALPWIVLGLYSITSGILAMLGRLVSYGLPGAIPSRYPTFAIPLWIALVPLWMIVPSKTKPAAKLLALVILALILKGSLFIRGEMTAYSAHRLAARVTAQFALVAPDDKAIETTLYPGVPFAVQTLTHLSQINGLPFQCFSSSDISTLAANNKTTDAGTFESLVFNANHMVLSGWAIIPSTSKLADAVVLTAPDSHGVERVFAIAFSDRERRPDQSLNQSGWSRSLDRDIVPRNTPISAWAFDSYDQRAYRLAGIQLAK